jgi:hypothetical protein
MYECAAYIPDMSSQNDPKRARHRQRRGHAPGDAATPDGLQTLRENETGPPKLSFRSGTAAGEIGDGTVARVCAEVPRRLWVPPDCSHPSRRG